MSRELKTFPLKPTLLSRLLLAGFNCVGDVIHMKPSELSSDANITPAEALDVLKTLVEDVHAPTRKQVGPISKSAFHLLQEEQELRPIVTLCQSLDDLMGGGVPLCKITEFCGAPGIGKTQMCMQLAVNAHIPECLGGLAGQVVYIDTEGSFLIDRMMDIAEAAVQHCQLVAQQEETEGKSTLMGSLTVDTVLSGAHYFRCQDHVELIATAHLLPKFLRQHEHVGVLRGGGVGYLSVFESLTSAPATNASQHCHSLLEFIFHYLEDWSVATISKLFLDGACNVLFKVRLIIVDSIACPFRHNFEDMSVRTRLLTTLAQSFIQMAAQFNVAVVLTNQMTTKIVPGAGSSHLIPALGESWGHSSTMRVILFWEENERKALLYKSASKPEACCTFQITTGGIRNVPRHGSLLSEAGSSSRMKAPVNTNPTEPDCCVPQKKQRIT